jgi:uncharacterized membrane protein
MRVLDCALSQLRLLWKRPLALFLPLQALLVSLNLGRLPVWTDELFTVQTAPQSLTRIIEIVRADIHPPLYFLLAHAWIQLPFPRDVLERIRLMSGVWTLAATFLLAVALAWRFLRRPGTLLPGHALRRALNPAARLDLARCGPPPRTAHAKINMIGW